MMIKKPARKIGTILLCALLCAGQATAFAQGEESAGTTDLVTCGDNSLKIDAANAKPEDLIREIGDKCGIKVVIFGEAFEDKPIGVKFQQLPVRKGIERVMRIANLSNFVLHFDNATVNPRIVELDIMGKKGGERQLTAGTGARTAKNAQTPLTATTTAASLSRQPDKSAEKPQTADKQDMKAPAPDPKDLMSEKTQEDFMKVMDEMMKAQEMGEEPDPAEVLRIFKEVVPQEVRDQIPADVLKEIEEFEKNPQSGGSVLPPGGPRKR